MTPDPQRPGVFVEEIPTGVRTITGVSTSIAAFIGAASRGRSYRPVRINSFGEFEQRFGGLIANYDLGYAVQRFFLNGGKEAWVVRVARQLTAAKVINGIHAFDAVDIFNLLVPGGICVVIDMNNRFPLFRSDLRNRLRRKKEKQCYVPSLEEYAAPFVKEGFELLRTEHFCWVPHSAGPVMAGVFRTLSPILNTVARSRAMRSLVVARKPL